MGLNLEHDASGQNAPDKLESTLYEGEETTYELRPGRRAEDEAHGWNIGQRMRPLDGMTTSRDGDTGMPLPEGKDS